MVARKSITNSWLVWNTMTAVLITPRPTDAGTRRNRRVLHLLAIGSGSGRGIVLGVVFAFEFAVHGFRRWSRFVGVRVSSTDDPGVGRSALIAPEDVRIPGRRRAIGGRATVW